MCSKHIRLRILTRNLISMRYHIHIYIYEMLLWWICPDVQCLCVFLVGFSVCDSCFVSFVCLARVSFPSLNQTNVHSMQFYQELCQKNSTSGLSPSCCTSATKQRLRASAQNALCSSRMCACSQFHSKTHGKCQENGRPQHCRQPHRAHAILGLCLVDLGNLDDFYPNL